MAYTSFEINYEFNSVNLFHINSSNNITFVSGWFPDMGVK